MFKSKKTPQCKKPASLPPDWRGFNHCYEMCRRQPLRISRPVVTLAVSMTLFKFATNSTTSNFPVPIQLRHCILHCLLVAALSSPLSIPSVTMHFQCWGRSPLAHPSVPARCHCWAPNNQHFEPYNRKLRLAVFVFGWVNCRVFENLMGTQVKPLDCAWAHKTPSQPITPFHSLSLSSWTQDTVQPC